ncbi:MAG: LicD family protein [Muribaculaceae bacterium]|nr:LicD family protein [Muribaculaceae bacterium]MDE6554296.1 LicD family protein [Muribaculaceae bacterium]
METKKALTVEDKQVILFDILKDIDAFCRKNNIKYSISDGTMLGAIRHGGFIPWDDDADICMLREDFDRFAASYKSERFQMLYKTQTENEFFYGGYIKINDPQTYSGCTKKTILFKHGVTVDIFPFDGVPVDEKERKKHMHHIRSIDNRLYHSQKKDLLSIIKSHRHSIEGWWNKLNETVHEGKYDDSPLVGQSVCVKDDRVVLHRDLFDNIVDIPFNGYNFQGFADSHEYLKFLFGEDYMTPKIYAHNYTIYKK